MLVRFDARISKCIQRVGGCRFLVFVFVFVFVLVHFIVLDSNWTIAKKVVVLIDRNM